MNDPTTCYRVPGNIRRSTRYSHQGRLTYVTERSCSIMIMCKLDPQPEPRHILEQDSNITLNVIVFFLIPVIQLFWRNSLRNNLYYKHQDRNRSMDWWKQRLKIELVPLKWNWTLWFMFRYWTEWSHLQIPHSHVFAEFSS